MATAARPFGIHAIHFTGPGCRVARGSRGKRPLVRWEPRRAERATPRSAETDAWRRLAGGAHSPIEPLQQPSRHRKIVVRSKRDGRGKLRVCGTVAHGNNTAHHLENTYSFSKT